MELDAYKISKTDTVQGKKIAVTAPDERKVYFDTNIYKIKNIDEENGTIEFERID